MDAETLCREVYAETRTLYAGKVEAMGIAAHGFRVLYGPPTQNPPFLFIGYQPGGSHADTNEHEGWPASCEYATADWKLAQRLRHVFGKPMLECCTGLNAIFFRSPSAHAWMRTDPILRNEVETFSCVRAARIVRALRPQRIVVIGLGTFGMVETGIVALHSGKRVLVRKGSLWGAPAFGIIHLSGARVSAADLGRLQNFFAATISN